MGCCWTMRGCWWRRATRPPGQRAEGICRVARSRAGGNAQHSDRPEALQAIADLDLDDLIAIQPSRGFGRYDLDHRKQAPLSVRHLRRTDSGADRRNLGGRIWMSLDSAEALEPSHDATGSSTIDGMSVLTFTDAARDIGAQSKVHAQSPCRVDPVQCRRDLPEACEPPPPALVAVRISPAKQGLLPGTDRRAASGQKCPK